MTRLLFSLLFVLHLALFARAQDGYDDPNAVDSADGTIDVLSLSSSTTGEPSDNKWKDDLTDFERFVRDHWVYVAIAGGVIVLCCICACCRCRRKRRGNKHPAVGQYNYYTEV